MKDEWVDYMLHGVQYGVAKRDPRTDAAVLLRLPINCESWEIYWRPAGGGEWAGPHRCSMAEIMRLCGVQAWEIKSSPALDENFLALNLLRWLYNGWLRQGPDGSLTQNLGPVGHNGLPSAAYAPVSSAAPVA